MYQNKMFKISQTASSRIKFFSNRMQLIPVIFSMCILLLPSKAIAAAITITGAPQPFDPNNSSIEWNPKGVWRFLITREAYSLGNDWSGLTHVHIEYDVSMWPTNLYLNGISLTDYWYSQVSIAASPNTAYMYAAPSEHYSAMTGQMASHDLYE